MHRRWHIQAHFVLMHLHSNLQSIELQPPQGQATLNSGVKNTRNLLSFIFRPCTQVPLLRLLWFKGEKTNAGAWVPAACSIDFSRKQVDT
jgi:hypothetical protein